MEDAMKQGMLVATLCLFVAATTFGFLSWADNAEVAPATVVKVGSLEKVYGSGISKIDSSMSIRVLILRHTPERMAIGDANLAKSGIERAKEKGLDIEVIGDELVRSLDDVKRAVNEKVSYNARPGDTLIVHTIGHGFSSGGLQNLGPRRGVMEVFVRAAEEHQQEMLWWQLSCYASASLPSIDSLTEPQQGLFSNLASSDSRTVSAAGIQGKVMEKVFVAIAEKDRRIDPDGDEVITASELKNFLNEVVGSRRGDLLYARSSDEPIFGVFGPWMLPIIDHNRPSREYERNFIPTPRWRVKWNEMYYSFSQSLPY